MFRRKQITVIFTVEEECMPGLFYDPEDFATQAFKAIQGRIPAYKPLLVSTLVEDTEEYSSRLLILFG